MHCHRANWSWRLCTTKTNHCRRSRSSPTTTRASIENSCPAGQGFSVPQCAGTLRKGQARKMGLCAGCGALAPSTILGTVGRKEVPRTCAILGAACVSSPVHPIRSLEGMTDTQRSGDSCTDFAVATGAGLRLAGVNVAELSLARMTRSSAFSLAMSLIICS